MPHKAISFLYNYLLFMKNEPLNVLKTLEEEGLEDNAIVVFISEKFG